MAYTGLANAEFVAYEMTSVDRAPDLRALSSGIAHARQAVALDEGLAEAHATLSFLLASAGQFDAARQSAERAVALEPDNWRHHYRLGHAAWAETRARALTRALDLYPQFAYALFEMAMLFVARGDLDGAEALVHQGITSQDRPGRSGDRFPAIGFHWLLGALEAARGHFETAIVEFDREIAQLDPNRLYAREYAAMARVWRGHALAATGRGVEATAAFLDALRQVPGYPRALVGLLMAHASLRQSRAAPSASADASPEPAPAAPRTAPADAARPASHAPSEDDAREALPTADAIRVELRRASLDLAAQRRWQEAAFLDACTAAADGRASDAVAHLDRLLDMDPPSFLGWTIPLEPGLRPLAAEPGFGRILGRLAERAK